MTPTLLKKHKRSHLKYVKGTQKQSKKGNIKGNVNRQSSKLFSKTPE